MPIPTSRPARNSARVAMLTGGRRRQGDDRVVNDLLRELGRPDLVITEVITE